MARRQPPNQLSDDGWFTVTDAHYIDDDDPPLPAPPVQANHRPQTQPPQNPILPPRPTPILDGILKFIFWWFAVLFVLSIFVSILKHRPQTKHTPPPVTKKEPDPYVITPPPVYSPPPKRNRNLGTEKAPKKNLGTVRIGPWPSKETVKKTLKMFRRPARRKPSDWDDAPPPKVRRRYQNRNRYNHRVQEQSGSSPPVNHRSGDEQGWY